MFHFNSSTNYIIRFLLIIFLGIIIRYNSDDYEKVIGYWKEKEYNFKVISFSGSRDYIIKGVGTDSVERLFEVSNFWEIADYLQPGDSIIKAKGSTKLKLIKHNPDTMFVFPLIVDGEVVWR
ncbi:MAG: hypothetical protein K6A82_01125 [Prevotella sp.]|nr:hypothetical protein [Prevotella sp.]